MRRTGTTVLLAAVSSLAIVWSAPALSGEIRGRLLVEAKPASGISVQAVPAESPLDEARREARRQAPPAPISSVVTAADGSFALPLAAAPPREFRIRVEGGGIVTGLVPGTFDTQESEDLGDLVAVKGGRLAGRLEKADGTPLAGAEVLLAPSRGIGSGVEADPQVARSGADGSFRFEAAHPDRNDLSVRADGSWFQPLSGIRAGAIAAPLVARPGGALSGTVRRSDKQTPAPGVLVRFEGQAKSRWVETAADGSFRMADVPAGTGLLLADGGDSGFAEILGARASANPVTATLSPGARLEGRVVDTVTGKAVPRAKVSAQGSRGLVSTRSGSDGKYLLRNLVPGRRTVRGDEPRYAPWERYGVVLRAGESHKLDLPLTPGVSISGTVVDENGVPVAGAKGSLGPAAQAGIRSLVAGLTGPMETAFVSASNGAFRASRLRAGDNLRLTVQHPGHETGALSGLNLPPGTSRAGLKVVLQQGLALTGFVRDEKQAGIAGAELTLSQSRSFGGPRSGMVFNFAAPVAGRPESVKTSGDGSFTFRGVPPGDYQLQVTRSGYATESMGPVKLARGETPKPVEVVLAPGAAIAGTVKLKDGTPQGGRSVFARSPGGGGALQGPGQSPTGPDGLFVLDGLKPGQPYDLLLLEPGALPRAVRSGVTAPADGIEVFLPTPGRITGIAVDAASNKPVADFQVWYDPDRSTGQGGGGQMVRIVARGAGRQLGVGTGEKVVVHAEDGGFALENVPAGNWEVNVEAQGYQTARVGGVTVAEGAERSGVTVKLSPGVTLTGKVVDTMSGRGVPNAQVQTAGAGSQGGPGAAIRLALPQTDDSGPATDADGAFQIDGMAPGKYSVSVRHPDYADGSESIEVKETGGSVRVALSAGSHIAGIVADASNQPLPGAQVALVAASDAGPMGRGGLPSSGTTTDQGGSFRFDHLAAGRYTVTASLRNASSSQQQVALAAGQSSDGLVISLSAGATVRGTVTGLSADKRGNVLVAASGADGFGSSVRSGADGSFEISGVPEGILMLRATAGDLLTSSRTKATEVQVPAGQTLVAAEIAFDPSGATVSGTVTRGGVPVSGGAVMVNARGGAGVNASGAVDESGRYRVEGVQNGAYSVTYLDTASGGAGTSKQVTVASDMTVDLDIPQGRITGLVVEAGSGLPLADVLVSASPAGAAAAAGGGPGGGGGGRTASTDSNGEFSLETLSPASFNVTARRSGYLFDPKSVTLSGSDTQDVTLQGKRSEGIGVQASDGLLGVPLRSLQARVRSAPSNVFVGGISLDGNGRGEIPSVPAGTYTVILDAAGYAPAVLSPVSVPSQTLVVALTPGGNVEIHAGAKTLAAGSAQATLRTAGGVAYPFSVFGQEGRVVLNFPVRTIQNVAPGSYTLALDSGSSQSFSVLEGQTAVVTLP